ncbi:PotD/PotF family extracellular solute-binding protein [Halobaculum sp. MBLA0147]|uniref:ABC transporter substrate-binding protein n=1 Tax=Halobaculum sp. MBLA0147 TaxID=3079934 RepID=UPI0035249FE3
MSEHGDDRGRTTRRAVLGATGAGIAGLSGCLGGSSGGGDDGGAGGGTTTGTVDSAQPFRNKTLRFSTWSGTNATVFEEEIKPAYEEKTGGTLEIVPGWSEILAKIRAAPADSPPYDLTVTGDRAHYIGLQSDLWEQIDFDQLDNAGVIKQNLLREDPISVPLAYGVMCYAYDEAAIGFDPGEWSDLTTEAEDAALPGSYFTNSLQMASIVSEEMPFDEELYSPEGHDAIFETLREIDTATFYTGAQDMWTAISQGVATLGQYFFAYSLKKRQSTDSFDIGLHVPERTTGYIDDYHLVRGTSRGEMAHDFLDFMLSAEMQTTYAQNFNMGMVNPETDYPSATEENVPLDNEALADVSFLEWADVAQYAESLNERFNELKSEV